MTKRHFPLGVVSLFLAHSVLAASMAPAAASAADPAASGVTPGAERRGTRHHKAQWGDKMQSLYRTLSALMTDVSSDERFADPKRRKEIEANAKKLAELAHDLKGKGVTHPDKDPSVAILSSLFADSAQRAYQSFKDKNTGYSRQLLRSIPGYCIACHTRNNSGPDFVSLPIEPASQGLRSIQRGEFYASTRQYDRALKEFEAVSESADIPSASKYALAIAVRVKQDPAQARRIVEKLIANPQTPFFMKEDARAWLASIAEWSKEPRRISTDEEGFYAESVRLLGQAHEAQKYPMDHSADILYLRASAAVHGLLQVGANGRYAGEGYLMAGLCYEVLNSFHIGEIQDLYYEVCVRTNPHSALGGACFHRYQQSIYFGYTGSSGTHLPQSEILKLRSLEEMAKPAPMVDKPTAK